MITDQLTLKLERIHALADILYDMLIDRPQAQVLVEIITETALLPED